MSINRLSPSRRHDPYFERETKRYAVPLPSREYILQTVEEQGKPVTFEALCELLDIQPDEQEFFQRRLRAMERAREARAGRWDEDRAMVEPRR